MNEVESRTKTFENKLNISLLLGILTYTIGTFTLDSIFSSTSIKFGFLTLTIIIFLISYILNNNMLIIYNVEVMWFFFLIYFIFEFLPIEGDTPIYLVDSLVFSMLFFYLLLVKLDIKYFKFAMLIMLAISIIYALSALFQFINMDLYSKIILPRFSDSERTEVLRLYQNGSYTGFTRQTAYISGYLTYGIAIALLVCNKIKGRFIRSLIIVSIPLLLFALFLGGKRAHLAFMIISLIVMYLFSTEMKKFFSHLLKVIILLLTLFIGVGLFAFLYTPNPDTQLGKIYLRFEQTIEGIISGEDVTSGRTILYEKALNLFYENPILGIGWKEFKQLTYGLLSSTSGSHPHNIYIQLLVELGIIGFLLFVIPVIYMYIKTIKILLNIDNLNLYDKWWKIGIQFSLFVQTFFLLYGLTGNLLTDHMYILIYAFAASITLSAIKYSKIKKN